ncbi:MAG TPA: metallopeptidase family protein [Jatrophihabitans sp.]|jgi:predicted Zn-dependent protease with MMP-like domain
MVADALDSLPPELGRLMRNVAVVVEAHGGDGSLLGLYEGVPLTERNTEYSLVLPDRITIFRKAILAACTTEEDVVAEVQMTVVHEIGHHFGIGDDRLRELGW